MLWSPRTSGVHVPSRRGDGARRCRHNPTPSVISSCPRTEKRRRTSLQPCRRRPQVTPRRAWVAVERRNVTSERLAPTWRARKPCVSIRSPGRPGTRVVICPKGKTPYSERRMCSITVHVLVNVLFFLFYDTVQVSGEVAVQSVIPYTLTCTGTLWDGRPESSSCQLEKKTPCAA